MKSMMLKVMWMGRATVFLVGLAVIIAAVFGLSSMAFAANGKPFILGKNNVATAITTLTKQGPGPALKLLVRPGQPPMAVNSQVRVANLNADRVDGQSASEFLAIGGTAADSDKLDGKDPTEFAPARSTPLWAHVNSNGTLVRGNGVQFSGRLSTGHYYVYFNRDVSFCGYVATTTDAYAGTTGTLQGASYGVPSEVTVYTIVGSTGARADLPFHLVVTC